MPAPKKIKQTEVEMVAALTAAGCLQEDIGTWLGISQSGVSRAAREAKKQRILVQQLVCTLSRKRRMELAVMAQRKGLFEKLVALQPADARHLKELWIMDIGEAFKKPGPKTYDSRVRCFGQKVAEHMCKEMFEHVRQAGWTWGLTLNHLLDGLAEITDKAGMRATDPVLCFPVSGDPPAASQNVLHNPSALAERFNGWINGGNPWIENFTHTAAAIPAGFVGVDGDVLRRFFKSDPAYSRVFGPGGLIETVDTIFTSAGSRILEEDPWISHAAAAAEIDPEILVRSTYGNLGGTFLPRRGASDEDKEMIERVNARWTGIQISHFRACAARALGSPDTPGVVLLSSGNKAEITIEAIRQGLVSTLFIDQDVAYKIDRELQEDSPPILPNSPPSPGEPAEMGESRNGA